MFFPILETMTFTEHDSAEAAVEALITMYDAVVELAEEALGSENHELYRDVVYPKLIVDVKQWRPIDRTEPYGYVDHAGRYSAVLSRPRMMRAYLMDMLTRLVTNYPCDIYTCYSDIQIPPVFIDGLENTPQNIGGIGGVTGGDSGDSAIPQPSLDFVDDGIVDSAWDAFHSDELPLFHFAPHRFDVACKRIEHYTGIPADGVQQFILFTNYAMHTTEFVKYGLAELVKGDTRYTHMLLPNGEKVTANNAATCEYNLDSRYQMPRYDLCTADGDGITIINIGVGPSNAKTITDCLAVLRPECWVMIGHCAGLDGRMPTSAATTFSTTASGSTSPSRQSPKYNAPSKPVFTQSTANPKTSCVLVPSSPPTTATGNGTHPMICGASSAVPPLWPLTWKALR